ncbi:hypothetical protein SAMN05443287_102442 [Micromonospora phaseoli]|uniref:Uncharacterized protein n=1 Tax=Micromonospora phaseoli TaxID=1144548 RepID=A0A1H6V5H5_9ACTN|nr:hypothetical protein [Micromonospora phaseoli]PZV93804.1 hypothetical protein CLV64_109265 [Micromonospora phaseoli]GIJ79920.1 hypothetical protein Xph01_43520 [Micromonospora phaseoli]SEI97067.1 hypothetical protein SAMN05443287_102442 [Micromonospora phaseoli]
MSRRTGRPSYLLTSPGGKGRSKTWMVAVAAAAVLVAAPVGGLVGHAVGRPSPTEANIAQLQKAEVERDAQQIVELTAMAHQTGQELSPILQAVRQEAEAGRTPEAAQVSQWQQTMNRLIAQFADPPSGMTATNVARGGLRSAVEQTAVAVDSVALALSGPAAGRTEQLALAARQATLAVTTWSVAATQLDQINIDAGLGHQHVHLDAGEVEGALTPDGATEGSGG